MTDDTGPAQAAADDRAGKLVFGLMAAAVLLPYAYLLAWTILAGARPSPILLARPVLWGGLLYLLYVGHRVIRWLVLVVVIVGAVSWATAVLPEVQAGHIVIAGQFAVLALVEVTAAAMLIGSPSLRDFLTHQAERRRPAARG